MSERKGISRKMNNTFEDMEVRKVPTKLLNLWNIKDLAEIK